jgi:filamentous hemagglutinin family protein
MSRGLIGIVQVLKTCAIATVNANSRPYPALGRKLAAAAILALCGTSILVPHARAQPNGGNISAGAGAISQAGTTTTINQSSQNLAINWQNFSIGSNEAVHFNQPNASSIALNRVLGQNPSQILGSLSANGQVFVLNPNGVLFGTTAQVNVGGLVASTLSLSDADFMAGSNSFSNTGTAGSVVNQGTLTAAQSGYIALLAPEVRNEGIITATLGTALLAAGDKVTLNLNNGSLLSYSVDQGSFNALAGNRQLIQADGGQVYMSARAADALGTAVVNNTGIIEARTIRNAGGVILLDGGDFGTVNVSGTLDASGLDAGETGGTVKVLGDKVALLDGARINASGDAGGGTVLVGGNYQGKGPEQNATAAYVASTAQINADAMTNGNGGKLIVWANDATRVYGSLSARGGAQSGNGGLIETSGKKYLDVTRAADASAAHGVGGTWLLDPNNITIQAAGVDTNVTETPEFTSVNDSAIVTTASIQAALNAGTSVIITTGAGGTNAQAGDITVADAIAKTAGGAATLTLTASNNIIFNSGASVTSTAGALNLTLNAPGDIITLRGIDLLGGTLTLNTIGDVTQAAAITGNTSVVKNGDGVAIFSQVNTYTGATTIIEGVLSVNGMAIADTSAVTVASGATLNLAGSETIGSLAGAGNVKLNANTLTTGGDNTSTSYSGVMSGTGGLSKAGTGTLTLSGVNTYTGVTTINAGVLSVATIGYGEFEGNLGAASNLAANLVLGGGTLQYTGATAATDRAYTLTAGTTSSIDVSVGANTLTMSGSSANTTGALTKTGAGTLTLGGTNLYTGATTINAGALSVSGTAIADTSAVTVASGATLNLVGSETVGSLAGAGNVTLGANTLTAGGNNTSTAFSGVVSGTGGLTKEGTGTLTLSGVNTYTGATTINAGGYTLSGAGTATGTAFTLGLGGMLTLDNVATNNTNRISDTLAFTMTGGELVFNGSNVAATNASETIGAMTLTFGGSWITLNSGTGGSTILTSASVARTPGARVLVRGTNLGATAGAGVTNLMFTTAPAMVGGNTTQFNKPIVPYLVGATSATATGTSFVTYNINPASNAANATGLRPLDTATEYAINPAAITAGDNVEINAAYATNVSSTLNSVLITGGVAWNTAAAGNRTYTITSGALLSASGANSFAAAGGTGIMAFGAAEGMITTAGTSNLTFSASDRITGTAGLTKGGAGTLTFNLANTYTGTTSVNTGTLAWGASNVIANTGAMNVNGGTLALGAFTDTVGALTLTSGSITGTTGVLTGTSYTLQSGSVSAILAGGTAVPLTKTTAGTVTLSGANTYTGITTINAGTLSVATIGNGGVAGNLGAATAAATRLVLGGGTLQYTGATATTDRAYTLTAATTSSIDVSVGANTLTMSGAGANTTGALTKAGAGTLTLTGANLYTGLTTVNAGTLTEGIANALSSGALTVNGGTFNLGTFSDTVGAVTLTSGSITGTTGVLTGTGYTVSDGAISAILAGAVPLTKTTAGIVTLSGTNTYTGVTTINGGMIVVTTIGNGGVAGNLGAATNAAANLVLGGGQIEYAGATASTDRAFTLTAGTTSSIHITNAATNLTISGASAVTTGSLFKIGDGTLTLSGTNGYTGTTEVDTGTLAYGVNNALSSGAVTVDGGTLALGTFSDTVGAVTLIDGSITGTSGVLTGTSYTVSEGAISAILAGAVPLTKTTLGTVTLSGMNTYSGVTTINGGKLIVTTIGNGGVAGNLGAAGNAAANLVLSGGELEYGGATASTDRAFTLTAGTTSIIEIANVGINLTMSGASAVTTGALTTYGNGTLTLSGANGYTGATTVEGGTLAYGVNNALSSGAVNVHGGTLVMGTFSDTVGTVTLTSGSITGTTGVLTATSYDMRSGSVSAILAGTGALTKTTAGTVILSGMNTYTGVTTINAGNLSVATIGNGGAAGNLGAATSAAANLVLGGGDLEYTGVTASTDRAFTLTAGTTSLIEVIDLTANLTMSGASAATTGALTVYGGGTLTLTGANQYTGATTVGLGTSVGTLSVNGAAIADTSAVTVDSGSTFNLTGSETIGSLAGAGNVTLNANTLTAGGDNTSTSYSGVASGTGGLIKAGTGTLTLSGVNTYTGATTINAGTVSVNGTALADTSAVAVASGATFDLTGNETIGSLAGAGNVTLNANTLTAGGDNTSTTYSGVASGTGGLTKAGSGTFTVSGASTYSGLTTVSAGTLKLGAAGGATNTPLGTTGAGTSMTAGAVLDLNGFTLGTAEALTLNGTGIGSGGALTNSSGTAATYSGAITLGSASSIVAGSGKSLFATGTINGAYALDVMGGGSITLGGSIGNSTPLASFSGAAGTTLNINGGAVSTTGAQTYSGATTFGATTTLTAVGISATGAVTATAGTLTLAAGTGNATLTNTSNNFSTVTVTSGADVSLIDANALTVAGISVTGLVDVRTQTGDLTLTTAAIATTSTSANAVTLVADVASVPDATGSGGNLINSGSVAITTGIGGAWRIYTGNPTGTSRGGLTETGKQYNVDDGSDPLASGNRIYFRIQPTLTLTAGNASKTYGDANPSFTYSNSGLIDGDLIGAAVSSGPSYGVSGTTSTSGQLTAGTVHTITPGAATATSLGYTLAYAAGTLTVNQRAIANVTGITASNKTYDGNTSATLTTSGASFTNMISGDVLSVSTATGTFSDMNAATGKTVNITGITLGGTDAGNYMLTSNTASTTADITPYIINLIGSRTYDTTMIMNASNFGSIYGVGQYITLTGSGSLADKNIGAGKPITLGTLALGNGLNGELASNYTLVGGNHTATINSASLALTGVTVADKVYDGTTTATLGGTPSISPLSGDSVTLSGTGAGVFRTKNVANGNLVTVSGFTLSGADAGNYTLTQQAGLAANITKAPLTFTGTPVAASRQYDGTTITSVSGVTINGLVGGDAPYLIGIFTTPSVGVNKSASLALTGAGAGNYSYTGASLIASITQRVLTYSGTPVAANRAYDGTITTTVSGITLSGVVAADIYGVTVSGLFANKNVGTGKAVTSVLSGSKASNYSLAPIAGLSANITAASLTISGVTAMNKVYNATTAATLGGTATISALGSDVVTLGGSATGTFSDKNAGTGKTVTVSGYTLSGADAGNYTVVQPGGVTANITPAAIANVTGITASNKTYDATTAATLVTGSAAFTNKISGDVLTVGSATGNFSDKNVANGKTVNISGITLGGADAGNYTLASNTASTTADITAASLSVTGVTATNKVYDATTAATLGGTAAVAALGSDVVSVGGSGSGSFADPNVGTAKPVSVSGYTISGTDAGNYTLIQPSGLTADITVRSLTVIADNNSMPFGGTIPPLTYTVAGAGLVGADSIASVFTGALFVDVTGVNPGFTAPITQGTLVLTVGPGGNYIISTFVDGVMTVQ